MIRLAVLQRDVDIVRELLDDAAPKEQGCFLLLREGRGRADLRLVAIDVLLPPHDAWDAQSDGHLNPSARWISSAVSRAISARAGLLFIHSHPDSQYPPGLSGLDRRSVTALVTTLGPMLEGPFAAAVVHPGGWSGEMWDGQGLTSIDRIVSVGRTLRFLSPRPDEARDDDDHQLDARQVDALGAIHAVLRDLHVGIVGVGGLGSPMAEQLVRMGVAMVTVIDGDDLDTTSNVRRIFGSTNADLRAARPPAKVDVVGRHLDQLGLETDVRRVLGDVRSERAFRALLDTDVVLCGTDNHGSRAIINELPSSYLLPAIDVGVRVGAKASGALAMLTSELRVLTPTTPCLWCRNAISADTIRAENMPAEARERLQAEGYVVGAIGDPAPSVVALTVMGSGLATCALLTLLSAEGDVAPSGLIMDGFVGYMMETEPREPIEDCRCRQRLALADTSPPSFVDAP